jgi:hypothetical protein
LLAALALHTHVFILHFVLGYWQLWHSILHFYFAFLFRLLAALALHTHVFILHFVLGYWQLWHSILHFYFAFLFRLLAALALHTHVSQSACIVLVQHTDIQVLWEKFQK